METTHTEVGDGIHRFATYIADAGLEFCQFLVDADEPLLFHTGHRQTFPIVHDAVARVIDPVRLRWIAFGHYEADECGSMNQWLAAAPHAEVAPGVIGSLVSVADAADRPPRPLADGEVLDIGGRRLRQIDTPHVPHGWDARVLYEETTGTLLCGDLFTSLGRWSPMTGDDLVEPSVAAEDAFGYSSITPMAAPTIRRLADLAPRRLALMHGPTFEGDGGDQLRRLADEYQRRLAESIEASTTTV